MILSENEITAIVGWPTELEGRQSMETYRAIAAEAAAKCARICRETGETRIAEWHEDMAEGCAQAIEEAIEEATK